MTVLCSAVASHSFGLLVAERDHVLVRVSFARGVASERAFVAQVQRHDAEGGEVATWVEERQSRARDQLAEYCAGTRTTFDLEVCSRGTPFQLRVWEALRRIRYGTTWTYAALARAIDSPRAVRAVGSACGDNPLAIVVPCHRVIGSDGSLVGYAGGLEHKRALLDHEAGVPALAELAALHR